MLSRLTVFACLYHVLHYRFVGYQNQTTIKKTNTEKTTQHLYHFLSCLLENESPNTDEQLTKHRLLCLWIACTSNTLHTKTFGQLVLFFNLFVFISWQCVLLLRSFSLFVTLSLAAGASQWAFRLLFYCVKCSVLSDS